MHAKGSEAIMSEDQTRIIEINGIKMEVDLRHAKRVDTLRIGDKVKCLVKSYGNQMNVHTGVVVGFEPFPSLPTIVVAYLDVGYAAGIKIISINQNSTDIEIIPDIDNQSLEINKSDILALMDREMDKKQLELDEISKKRAYFIAHFGRYFNTEENQ